MLYVLPVAPEHSFAGRLIAPGVVGICVGVIVPVECSLLVPHPLVAVTLTIPFPPPIVIVADVVDPPAVTAHPIPRADHV